MIKIVLAILTAPLLFHGCAAVPNTQLGQDQKAKNFTAAGGRSSIYIFRNTRFSSGLSIPLLINGKPIGLSQPFSYFLVDVEPGLHQITCEGNSNAIMFLKTRPDKTYFVRQDTENGFNSVRCLFYEVSFTEGKNSVNECSLAQATP